MSVTTMTIGDLCVSPYNVRQNAADANAIEGMAESLLARGQLYPLVVHPMPGRKGKRKWGALAGGRRFRAFSMLIDQGRLPAEHPIEVIVRDITDEAELVELSLAENLVRVELRPYEVYAAVARAHDRGRSLREIADTNGQTVETIRRWARVGNLHPNIFLALEQGHISQDQAKAFAATEDQALQLHVFRELDRSGMSTDARGIRRLLKVGDGEQRKLLLFIGEQVYADAGGRYELDLFADDAEQRGRVVDEGLLMQLVDAKLEEKREQLRRQAMRPLRFEREYPHDKEYGGVARDLEIYADSQPRSDADRRRLDYLKEQMLEVEAKAEQLLDEPDTVERAAAIAALDAHYVPMEEEFARINDRARLILPEGDVFGTLVIEPDGELEIRWWWGSRKAKRAADKTPPAKPVSAGPIGQPTSTPVSQPSTAAPITGSAAIDRDYGMGVRQKADAAIREREGLSAEGVQIFRSLRREMLRAALVVDAEDEDSGNNVASDYLLWSLLRDRLQEFTSMQPGRYAHERGMAGLSIRQEVPGLAIPGHLRNALAHDIWKEALDRLKQHSCVTDPDLQAAFTAFRTEGRPWKQVAAAIVVGCALERSLNAGGYHVPLHDHLAHLAGYGTAELQRSLIEPTEEMVDLMPRSQRLALAEPHVSNAEFAGLQKLKAAELTAPVTRALRAAKDWVHPLLRFGKPEAADRAVDQAKVVS